MARENLKKARLQLGLTQQQMANSLNITVRYYQFIEAGTRIGNVTIWDKLEKLTKISQSQLREI